MDETETHEPAKRSAVEAVSADPSSRKRFLKAVGGAGAAAALATVIAACGDEKQELTPGGSKANTGAGVGTDLYGPGDLGIARYALTLEYLEVDFYAAALQSGKLTGRAAELAKRFAAQERQHVVALEGAIGKLGGEPPTRVTGQFPLTDQKAILEYALELEDLGADAYLAQVDRIEDKELLTAALAIHTVEGRHAAALASVLGQDPAPVSFAVPAAAGDVLSQVQQIASGSAG